MPWITQNVIVFHLSVPKIVTVSEDTGARKQNHGAEQGERPSLLRSRNKQGEHSLLPHGLFFAQGRGPALGFFSPSLLFLARILDWLKVNSTAPCLQPPWSSPAEVKAEPPQPSCLAWLAAAKRKVNPSVSSSPWPSTSGQTVPAAFVHGEVRRGEGCHNFPFVLGATQLVSCRGHHFGGGVTPPF